MPCCSHIVAVLRPHWRPVAAAMGPCCSHVAALLRPHWRHVAAAMCPCCGSAFCTGGRSLSRSINFCTEQKLLYCGSHLVYWGKHICIVREMCVLVFFLILFWELFSILGVPCCSHVVALLRPHWRPVAAPMGPAAGRRFLYWGKISS